MNAPSKYAKDENFPDLDRSERPSKINEVGDSRIVQISLADRQKSSQDIANEYDSGRNQLVNHQTISRLLLKAGIAARVAVKKPFINEANRQKRLNFACQHWHWKCCSVFPPIRTSEAESNQSGLLEILCKIFDFSKKVVEHDT
uniref:Transposase Tc1-like domain-containing protein n=1 Tax=Romanomermis culicivorax TaxID=13658 RepID=A0A915IE15_ROMCU